MKRGARTTKPTVSTRVSEKERIRIALTQKLKELYAERNSLQFSESFWNGFGLTSRVGPWYWRTWMKSENRLMTVEATIQQVEIELAKYGGPAPGILDEPARRAVHKPRPPVPAATNAYWSLVLGILSLFFFWVPFIGALLGILGVVFGIVAIQKIRKQKQPGTGKAIVGIILGLCALVLVFIAFIGTLLIVSLIPTPNTNAPATTTPSTPLQLSMCKQSSNPDACYPKFSPFSALDPSSSCYKKANGYTIGILACKYEELGARRDQLNLYLDACPHNGGSPPYPSNQLKEMCTAGLGAYFKDPSICDQAGEYKADCYIVIARTNPDYTLADCDKAGTVYIGCYLAISVRDRNPEICGKIPAGSKDDCIEQIAVSSKNLSLCAKIGGSQSLQCARQFAASIPESNYTIEFCEAVTNIGGGTGTGGPNPDQCWYSLAIRTLSLDSCDRIMDLKAKSYCRELVQHALRST